MTRQILVDLVRKQRAAKRGGPLPDLTLDSLVGLGGGDGRAWSAEARAASLLDLDAGLRRLAVRRLAVLDPRAARVVELRFFGGLMETEAAEVVGVSVSTVRRDWREARLWLMRALTPDARRRAAHGHRHRRGPAGRRRAGGQAGHRPQPRHRDGHGAAR